MLSAGIISTTLIKFLYYKDIYGDIYEIKLFISIKKKGIFEWKQLNKLGPY